MNDIIDQFERMMPRNEFCSNCEQLYLLRDEARKLLRTGCNEYQFIVFDNFNKLIESGVCLDYNIYPERIYALVRLIREYMIGTKDSDLHNRLLYSYQMYDAIVTMMEIEQEVEEAESYNYVLPSVVKPNDSFWHELH